MPNASAKVASPTGEILLRAAALRRELRGQVIVRDASLTLRRGEVVAITGPSGAGKSSLLRLLNLLDAPTSGHVWLEGAEIATLEIRELRRRVGMVMQQPNLFSGTVEFNVRYGPSLRGEAMSDAQVESLLKTVGLDGYAAREVSALSGGEAQRVSLARTLANRPLVLLLDEPTSALDEASKLIVEAALQAAMQQVEGACLIVTHDAAQAARLAGRTLTMVAGVLRDALAAAPEHDHAL